MFESGISISEPRFSVLRQGRDQGDPSVIVSVFPEKWAESRGTRRIAKRRERSDGEYVGVASRNDNLKALPGKAGSPTRQSAHRGWPCSSRVVFFKTSTRKCPDGRGLRTARLAGYGRLEFLHGFREVATVGPWHDRYVYAIAREEWERHPLGASADGG